MNGWDDGYDYAPMPDDDDGPEQTGIECPFCRHEIVWIAPVLVCDNCEVNWDSADEIERDRLDILEGVEATAHYLYNRGAR